MPCSGASSTLPTPASPSYGGTVDKHIGDCVMAVFGAPVAHGNDAERCVRAALDIQRRMPALAAELGRPVGVHIGVASGEVVASGTGSARHREYTVTGESVNLASRLTDMARRGRDPHLGRRPPGARRPARLRRDAASWRSRGSPSRSGRGGCSRCTSRPARPPDVRRSARRAAAVRSGARACRDTGRGQAIYIRGEAGIGKTRLLEEFQTAAEGAGLRLPQRAGARFRHGHRPGRHPLARAQPARPVQREQPGRDRRAANGPSSDGLRACRAAGLPERSPGPAAADRAADALRCHGQRQPAIAASGRHSPGSSRRRAAIAPGCWRSRTCTGPTGSLSIIWRPRRHGRRVPGASGHDLADRGRSARRGLAPRHAPASRS